MWNGLVDRSNILITRWVVQQSPEFECLHLTLSDWDTVGVLVPLLPNGFPARAFGCGLGCDVGVPLTICLE